MDVWEVAFPSGMNTDLRASWLARKPTISGEDQPPAEAGAAEELPVRARGRLWWAPKCLQLVETTPILK